MPRERAGSRWTGAARQVRARGLRGVRPDARDGREQPARPAPAGARARARARRCGCCASSTPPAPTGRRPGRARPLLRRRRAASRRCSTSCRPPATACSSSSRTEQARAVAPAVTLPPGASRARRRRRRGHQRGLPRRARRRARGVREDAPRRGPGRVRGRGRRSARGSAEPGALRTPRVLEVAEDYLALEWMRAGRLERGGRGGARPRSGAHPRRRRRPRSATPVRLPAPGTPTRAVRSRDIELRLAAAAQRAHRGLADASTPQRRLLPAGAHGPRARRALAARARGRSSGCASAWPSLPARPSRRRGCTATCGAGNVMADARRAPLADRPLGLRRATARSTWRCCGCSAAPPSGSSPPTTRPRPLAEGWRGARRALPAAAAARARAAVRRLLPSERPNGSRCRYAG